VIVAKRTMVQVIAHLWRTMLEGIAVGALAFKWIRGVFRCWQDRVAYDATRYFTVLAKRGSHLMRHRDGEYRCILDIGVPRFNDDGSFAGCHIARFAILSSRGGNQCRPYCEIYITRYANCARLQGSRLPPS
jgi:hypothetical protein